MSAEELATRLCEAIGGMDVRDDLLPLCAAFVEVVEAAESVQKGAHCYAGGGRARAYTISAAQMESITAALAHARKVMETT